MSWDNFVFQIRFFLLVIKRLIGCWLAQYVRGSYIHIYSVFVRHADYIRRCSYYVYVCVCAWFFLEGGGEVKQYDLCAFRAVLCVNIIYMCDVDAHKSKHLIVYLMLYLRKFIEHQLHYMSAFHTDYFIQIHSYIVGIGSFVL